MYKKIKTSIKPLIKDPTTYKKVKAEIKKVVSQELPWEKIPKEKWEDIYIDVNGYVQDSALDWVKSLVEEVIKEKHKDIEKLVKQGFSYNDIMYELFLEDWEDLVKAFRDAFKYNMSIPQGD